MQLTELRIHQCRNISQLVVRPVSGFNWWLGPNGVGKTTILEAIYLLSTGRSFRTSQARCVVTYGSPTASVYATLQLPHQQKERTLGISRHSRGEYQAQLDGHPVLHMADLARALPVVLIHPDSLLILAGDAVHRRQWIDWGLFHVEPFFQQSWSGYHRILRQRNALLKAPSYDSRALAAWDAEFITYGQQLTTLRQRYVEAFLCFLQPLIQDHLRLQQVSIAYSKGWAAEVPFEGALAQHAQESRMRGHTVVGPHRADLDFYLDGVKAQHRLSRGQQKLFIYLLQIAQCQVFQAKLHQSPVILIDDMGSELDAESQSRVLRLLIGTGCQVFLSAIDMVQLDTVWGPIATKDSKTFHVEHYHLSEKTTES